MLTIRDFNFLEDVYDVLFMELRESDIKELKDSTGNSPREALANIINSADVLKVFVDEYDRILAVYGVKEIETNIGTIFFLATEEFTEEHPIEFLRMSKVAVEELLKSFEVLFNYVSSENKKSIKWLKWLGFEVYENSDEYFENPEVPFYFFIISIDKE
jgi:ribosomal protein S18 acetylase RimI-like enzyme